MSSVQTSYFLDSSPGHILSFMHDVDLSKTVQRFVHILNPGLDAARTISSHVR